MTMMYVEQSLAPEEKLIHVAHFHWFYDVQAFSNIVWGLFFAVSVLTAAIELQPFMPAKLSLMTAPLTSADGWMASLQKLHPGIKLFSLLVFMMGVLKFARMLVIKITTEIAVTTSRVIYKRGLVARYVGEMNINRIEGVSVQQSFWGRIFDFGRVDIRGMGVGELYLPPIAKPLVMRRAVEKARLIAQRDENNNSNNRNDRDGGLG